MLEYGHSPGAFGATSGCSVIGGYVSRDPQVPELAGQYVYGDYCASRGPRGPGERERRTTEDRELPVTPFRSNSLV